MIRPNDGRDRPYLGVLALTCVFLLSSVATSDDKCGSIDRADSALKVTQTLYPELKAKEVSLQFSEGTGGPLSGPADVRSFVIAIDKPQWHPPREDNTESGIGKSTGPSQRGDLELPWYLRFEFIYLESGNWSIKCRPVKFLCNTEPKWMQEAKEVINAHPDWTEEEMLTAAKQHGLRFGPNDKAGILRLIPLRGLSKFYGPLRIRTTRFDIYGNAAKCKGCTFADLHWYVDAEEVGTPRALQITVEPFQGRIDGISEYEKQR